jgi:octaprenyl-diphosphate synthase
MSPTDAHSFDRFRAPIRDELDSLERAFRASLQSDIPIVREICAALAQAPGKRIRPGILLLASKSAGGDPVAAGTAGLAVELIHTATLLHDDVIDGHMVRRGRPTVYARWGATAATIMGDFLFSKAFACLGDARLEEIMAVLARVTNEMSVGEMIQLQNRRDINIVEDGYMELIHRKTAALFSAAAECGALTGGSAREHRADLAGFGENVGLAFQITDDLIDYVAPDRSVGKPVASDFSEGRITLPFIAALRNAPGDLRRRFEGIFRNGFNPERDWGEVVGFVREYGGIDYSLRKAGELGIRAKDALATLRPSRERDSLCFAADYIVDRVRNYAG